MQRTTGLAGGLKRALSHVSAGPPARPTARHGDGKEQGGCHAGRLNRPSPPTLEAFCGLGDEVIDDGLQITGLLEDGQLTLRAAPALENLECVLYLGA